MEFCLATQNCFKYTALSTSRGENKKGAITILQMECAIRVAGIAFATSRL
jgi:hypothetical protein